jgi:hypothetical protein
MVTTPRRKCITFHSDIDELRADHLGDGVLSALSPPRTQRYMVTIPMRTNVTFHSDIEELRTYFLGEVHAVNQELQGGYMYVSTCLVIHSLKYYGSRQELQRGYMCMSTCLVIHLLKNYASRPGAPKRIYVLVYK